MANGPAEVLLCKVARIRNLIRRGTHAAFVANLYAASARQGFHAWRKLQLLSCYEIADRILLYLRWQAEGSATEAISVTPSALAEYLGVNRTAIYRAIDKLKRRRRHIVSDGKVRDFSANTGKCE